MGRLVQACLQLAAICFVATTLSAPALAAGVKVYVDTSGIDARRDLTDDQKKEVKAAMQQEIKKNLEQAFGPDSVTVTDKESEKATADRTVTTENTVGKETDKNGKTSYHWGEWEYGSSDTTIHVGTYMDDPPGVASDFQKPDGSWDTAKLGKAMGTTSAHEVAHSYSAGHDDTNVNKMNTANSGTDIAGGLNLNNGAKNTLKENKGQPPCKTVTNYKSTACLASWWSDPDYPWGFLLHEPFSITTGFGFAGPLSAKFDFGWWGIDTDNGVFDGNSWGDFVYKSSMTGTPEDNSRITFFDGWTAHFVIRGRAGTPFEGQYFNVPPGGIVLSNDILRPDGTTVSRHIDLMWDVDGVPGPDVVVSMDTNVYGPGTPLFSGFRLGLAEPVSIPEAKRRVEGDMVFLAAKRVTAVFADCVYITEEPHRHCGIRVNYTGPASPGDRLFVTGKIRTNAAGERLIEPTEAFRSPGPELGPVGLTLNAVGGGDFEYTAGLWPSGQQGTAGKVGVNNVGAYIKVWGRVTEVEPSPFPTWFVIDDGSASPTKVSCHEPPFPAPHMYVIVRGVSSCEAPPEPGEKPASLIRAVHWEPVAGL